MKVVTCRVNILLYSLNTPLTCIMFAFRQWFHRKRQSWSSYFVNCYATLSSCL